MNERIKQLADEARIKPMGSSWAYRLSDEFEEKFAELIVRECLIIVEPTQHHQAFAQGYLGDVEGLELLDNKAKQIKEHFGVKE